MSLFSAVWRGEEATVAFKRAECNGDHLSGLDSSAGFGAAESAMVMKHRPTAET